MARPQGCHRAGGGFMTKSGLCPRFPVLSPATSLPNAWFSSSLNKPGRGREGARKLSPAQRGLSGFPEVRQWVAVTQAGPCCPDLQSPAPVTRSAPSLSKIALPQPIHLGIFAPFLCQQLNVPSGELGTVPPRHLPPVTPSPCGAFPCGTTWGKEHGSATSPKANRMFLGGPVFL